MRTSYSLLVLLTFLQLCFLKAPCQVLRQYSIPLKRGAVIPAAGFDEKLVARINKSVMEEPVAAILQFSVIPTDRQKKTLFSNGIRLLNYLGGNAYVVSIHQSLKTDVLINANGRSILSIELNDKLSSSLQNVTTDTTVHASIFPFVALDDAATILNEKGFTTKKAYGNYPVLQIHVPAGRLNELADFSFVEYIEPPPPPLTELNYISTSGTRANVLHTSNYNLNGEGIIFQVNEITGYPQNHIDFLDRSINNRTIPDGSYHSTHVHGIITGAGLINELYKGYAPKARFNSNYSLESPIDIITYGADLTNNSYASGSPCSKAPPASDKLSSLIVDKQSIEFRSLIHVMAAGNSGELKCPLFPNGYNTVYSGYQSAKSALTVGAAYVNGALAIFSSKGPGRDRRLKPEIVGPGAEVISTTPKNSYGYGSGTSMACPAVVGGLGLLYQRYQQLHNTKPDNALMKPLLCNTATDYGTVGPDYSFGFGLMNLYRAIEVLDAGNFFKDSVRNQEIKTKTINVPQGMAKLKVMLYWPDPPATPLTVKPLVNDLDIRITTPSGFVVLPYILDTLPALVTNAATHGVDHINNIEQIVIDNPQAGNYAINIEGYEIGEGPQEPFYVVYDLVPDNVQLTFPANGEVLAPGDNVYVQWDNWGNTVSNFTLEFSTDNGQNWQPLSSSIPPGPAFFSWTVPENVTNEARLRITRNSDGKTSTSDKFRITGVPAIKLSSSQCPESISIEWPRVTGASDYEVMWYHNGDMTPVLVTTDTSYTFRYLSEDSVYYVTVRARNNGLPGRRAYALSVQPNKGDCKDPIRDHDLKPLTLVHPLVGRAFTQKQLRIETVKMQIKNLDDDTAARGFTVAYSVNGKPWVSETVNDIVSPNGILNFSFQTPVDFSAPGNYNVRLAVTNPGDVNHQNDTLICIVRQLANTIVPLQSGVSDNGMLANGYTYASNYTGIQNLERFDYENINTSQTLRVGNGIVFDYSQNPDAGKPQSVIATYNLSLFDTAKHFAELQFRYSQSSSTGSFIDSLLIRGNDNAPWGFVKRFLPVDSPWYVYKTFTIPLTDYLKSQGQNFSSSFQVRWTVSNYYSSVTLNDIKLFDKTNDAGLISIDSLLPYNCNLSKAVPIQVTLQNSNSSEIHDLPIKYRINKGNIVSETVPFVPGLTTMSYQFKQTADLTAVGDYNIEAWIENQYDAYPSNDSSSVIIQNQELVTTFPYIEDLEKGNGGWFTAGTNSSWEYGTPTSPLINGSASGNKAWKTNLDGNYNSLESSVLYSGCYDFSQLSKPVVSISLAMNTDSCPPFYCDLMQVQYCINGKDWASLNNRVTSVQNWQTYFTSRWYNRWHVVSGRMPDTLKTVRFRFQFRSDNYNTFEGIGIDDVHIYDSTTTIYQGNSANVQQTINGGQQWIEFKKDGKLLAAIQPQAQDLGVVQLQTFINTGPVRNFHGQYYLNRNFVFKPAKALNDSVIMRLYFTDKESDSLLFAGSCNSCTLPKNAYRFGISYFKTSDSTELDSSIVNNRKGQWSFIPNSTVKTVPFMNGYYVEFKIKEAGEFRLSNGGLDGKSDLPVQIQQFSAERFLSNSILKWNTPQEINIDHFDLEVAKGNAAFQSDQFQKIGEVKSKGRSASPQSYSFTDQTQEKKGIRYYRLKNVDAFGNYSYSNALPVAFNEELEWQVFPNPSNGKYNLLYQSVPGDNLQLRIFNSIGELMKEIHFTSNGFIQKQEVDLSKHFANGVYILQIRTQEKTHILRLVKQ